MAADKKYDLSAFDNGVQKYDSSNVDLGAFDKAIKPTDNPDEIGLGEAALRGAADYSTFGFADELEAMLRSGAISGEEYEKKRDQLRDIYKQAAEQHPIAYHGAGVASSFALPIGGLGGFATKGATLGAKLGRSALMGAGMGALAGAGSSEASDATGVLKDTAIGGLAGGIAGPAIEGGMSALGRLGEATYNNIGPVKAILDTGKFAAQGDRIVGEEGGRITTQNALKSSGDVVGGLKGVQEAKNKAYKAAEEASNFTIKVKDLRDKIQQAEDNGADPTQLSNLKKLLNKLAGEEPTTPVNDDMSKLLSDTYNTAVATAPEAEEKVLRPADLNLLKQEAKKIKNRNYGVPSDAATELSNDINSIYKNSIDASQGEAIDKNLREALAKLGMSGATSKPQLAPNDVERLTDKLLKKTTKASADKGSIEFKKTEDAFNKLIEALPEGSKQQQDLKQKISQLKEDSYKTFLSDITRGHNTFAISPTNLNWTMTAAGKLGFAAEAAGATYRGIVNSPPGKLLGIANDLRQKGFSKYAETLNKIAGTEDVSKRRALTFTLLQNPDFRKLVAPDAFGDE